MATKFLYASANHTYYIDSFKGKDTNTGISRHRAWKSLQKVNAMVFKPGDKILFKSGTVYTGQLKPKGVGTAESPIIINSYGRGKKPLFKGEGKVLSTVYLYNVEFWELNNLEITNTGHERQAFRRGLSVEANNFGDAHHIYLRNLFIHDVNGSLVKKQGGGGAIYWKNSGDSIKTRFIDLRIENNYLLRCDRNGINSSGISNRSKWNPSLGVVIRNNILEEIPGDGIVPIGCDGALIEYNVMRNSPDILSPEEAAAGIWPWSSDHTLIQYNEVSGHKAKWDGQGFDSDYNCQNTIIQYNYSHDNYGGFLLVCNDGKTFGTTGNIGTKNSIIRYNLSVNDGLRPYKTKNGDYLSPSFHISGPVSNTKIYNNIICVPLKSKDSIYHTVVKMDNWGGPWPLETSFANNIFITKDTANFDLGKSRDTKFTHNVFNGCFKNMPEDKFMTRSNSHFKRFQKKLKELKFADGLRLKSGSSFKRKSINVASEIIYDFFGDSGKPQKPSSIESDN
nr:right-handed parallel beta-helix repeat-containing protein [uncultured Pedobacter sp.]